jgi:hypothetical protein
MRLTRWTCGLLVAAGSACSGSLTAPPTGLPVTMSHIGFIGGVRAPSITGAGDSVVALAVDQTSPCAVSETAVAGLRSGTLVATLISVVPRRPCAVLAQDGIVVVMVHNVPSGMRTARLVLHTENGGHPPDLTLAAGTIRLP